VGHELHHEHPERVDADRDRNRVDHGGEQHGGGAAVQQFANAELGIDAGCECEDRGGELERDLEPLDAVGEQD
jgi:hypothetical protein